MASFARSLAQAQPPRLWKQYCIALEQKPLLTKTITSVVGFGLGDAIAQWATKPKGAPALGWKFDYTRMARMAAFGGLVAGPIGHYWFTYLDKVYIPSFYAVLYHVGLTQELLDVTWWSNKTLLPNTLLTSRVWVQKIMPHAPTRPRAIITKILLDQSLQAPFGTAMFFAFMNATDGRFHETPETLKQKFPETIMASYKLWPAAHIINFAFVPSSQRVLYINIVSIVWTYILSIQAASGGPSTVASEAREHAL